MSTVVYFVLAVETFALVVTVWGAHRERVQNSQNTLALIGEVKQANRAAVRAALARNGIEYDRAEAWANVIEAQKHTHAERSPERDFGPPQEGFG